MLGNSRPMNPSASGTSPKQVSRGVHNFAQRQHVFPRHHASAIFETQSPKGVHDSPA